MIDVTIDRVAQGVWRFNAGWPAGSYCFAIDEGNGEVTLFDSSVSGAEDEIARALGRHLRRIVLSHAHCDHRGGAAGLKHVPIVCHPLEVDDAQGDGGLHYADFSRFQNEVVGEAFPQLIEGWDGGPVKISATIQEGDRVADFEVIGVPGHAPGQIALYRPSDKLLLAADSVYTMDGETGQPAPPRVPHPALNHDTDQAAETLRELSKLDVDLAWPSHSEPITGRVAEQLRAAADVV